MGLKSSQKVDIRETYLDIIKAIYGKLSGKESTCQHRRRRFNSWIRKIPWRREWLLTLVFLPGKSHGQRSLVGYSPRGRKGWDMTEVAEHVPMHPGTKRKCRSQLKGNSSLASILK